MSKFCEDKLNIWKRRDAIAVSNTRHRFYRFLMVKLPIISSRQNGR